MKKQFYINEIPVKCVSFQWTVWSDKGDGGNWLETDDLTPRELLNRMNNGLRYEDFHIAAIGFESFGYPPFTVEFKEDGAHLYVSDLTDEAIRAADQEYRDWEAEYEASRAVDKAPFHDSQKAETKNQGGTHMARPKKYFFTPEEIEQYCEARFRARDARRLTGTPVHIRQFFPAVLAAKTQGWTCKHFELAEDRSGLTIEKLNQRWYAWQGCA